MVNIVSVCMSLLPAILKLVGLRSRQVELEPGTTLHFWVPKTKPKNQSKPSVVFLQGLAFNAIVTWQFQAIALASKYDVYIPDFLFFGESITSRTDRSPDFQAECVAKGLRKLGVEKCTLVGVSYGGMVGFRMAEMYPELVESLVVSCAVMALTESISRSGLERIGVSSWTQFLIPDTINGVKQLLDFAMYESPRLPKFFYKAILELFFGKYKKERTELVDALIISGKEFSLRRYPQKIHVIWGEDDKIFNKKEVDNLIEQLEGKATVHYIRKAGHVAQVERPRIYNRHLKKILSSIYSK